MKWLSLLTWIILISSCCSSEKIKPEPVTIKLKVNFSNGHCDTLILKVFGNLKLYEGKLLYLESKLYNIKRKLDMLTKKDYDTILLKTKISSKLKNIVSNIVGKKISQAYLKCQKY